ncbi:MAG TPA: Ig-like domain-containing protein [Vicinamibacterales bacterium]|nr:Ig-like domain-containing protein [Vicinamibacterales bacterium]
MMRFRRLSITLVMLLAATAAIAQPQPRRATTITALRSYPGFYHQQTVLVIGEVKGLDQRMTIGTDEGAIKLVAREAPREGKLEARGQFLDIGRVSQDDPRLIPFNLLDRIRAAYQDRWPKPGEELMLILGGTAPPPAAINAAAPPLRALAMEPAKFEGQKVTITGQFRGRNLFGDLPEAPAQNRFEFVLRSSDAAVWVMGVQPKGKTFNFDPSKRIDTGRWVKVQGTVHTAKGLTWLDATSIELAPAPEETTEVAIPLPPPPPVEILFTAPTEGESDVRQTERIRMQLSRDLDPATLKDHVRMTYSAAESKERGEAQPPAIAFTTNYTKENRALEIHPTEPLERFRLVTLEIIEGVKGTDGGAMAPFTLTFRTGGS